MEDLREKLKTEIDQADWAMLKPHFENGAVLIVDEKLDLVDVGVAIALDKVEIVKLWLEEALLSKPSNDQAQEFAKDDYLKKFQFIIIQPYVLVKIFDKKDLS